MNTQMKTFNSNCRILFAACLGALCLVALSTQAATITVMNTNNSAAGSLRQALADAVDGDTIDATGISGTITLTTGQLVVDKDVMIDGPGADVLAVDANHTSRVFYISPGKTVAISGLTITNGNGNFDVGGGIWNDHATLTVSNCTLSGNFSYLGGGIFNGGQFGGSATLTINNSTLSGNYTGDALGGSGMGGGIANWGEFGSATLIINNSTLSGNSANYEGGIGGGIVNAAFSGSATLTINNSTLSENWASTAGGGIFSDGRSGNATLTINNSTLSSNSAFFGAGAIDNVAGSLTITNSTLSGNSANGDGGGAIWNVGVFGSATLTVHNSTLSGNSASSGGGIYNVNDDSGSASAHIGNTILKTGASGENIYNLSGTVTSDGYNLSNDNGGGFLTAIGDQINTDPLLGPLQDNGGPTFTHELLSGSPAIDAGDPNFTPPPDYDQRGSGFPRVLNGRIDIGAFEVQTVTPAYAGQVQPPINPDGSSTFNVRRGVVPIKFNLTQGGVATCDLPPATIAVTRTAGGVVGQVNESVYSGNADTGSTFRIDSCQYIYNLNSRALGVGTYRVDILIDGQVVGSATFGLN